MMPFEEALDASGPLVAAWDYEDNTRTRLRLYAVGELGARAIASTMVPLDQREDWVDRLIERGIRIGADYAGSVFVWVADDEGFAVWASDRVVAKGELDSAGVECVTLFVDPADSGHRGVRFTRTDGQLELIVEEHDPIPGLDPAYGSDDLFLDTLWARYLGEHLALGCLVPFVSEISGDGFAADLTIARAARTLADQVDGSGPAEALVQSLGPIGRAAGLALRVDPAQRSVELQITTADGATLSVRIKEGTSAMVAAFLRRVSTPRCVQFAMNDQLNQHKARP